MTISREEPRMSLPVRLSLLFCAAALSLSAGPLAAQTLKIATIAPESSSWMRDMRAAAKVIEEHTDGRVRFKFYGGGVQGNDKQVQRKMRTGQLHGGAFTSGGLNQFQADAVEMKLFASDQLDAHAHEPGPALFRDFIARARPNCGRLDQDKLEYPFGSQAGETGSAALIPLTAPPLAGVLAIGSRDPERFHQGKSVDFLQRLAEVVSAKLQSASSPGI